MKTDHTTKLLCERNQPTGGSPTGIKLNNGESDESKANSLRRIGRKNGFLQFKAVSDIEQRVYFAKEAAIKAKEAQETSQFDYLTERMV